MTGTPFHAYYTARLLETLQDDDKFIPTFASSDIRVYPYQIGAALFATRSPYAKGVVLMDESGLGKSTEAMLVAFAESVSVASILSSHRREVKKNHSGTD